MKCFWCDDWNVAVSVKKTRSETNVCMLSQYYEGMDTLFKIPCFCKANPLLPWCIWHQKSWLETGLLSSNTKKPLYHHVLPCITISQNFPKVRSPNGLQIHNSAWRLLGCIGGGWDLQIPMLPDLKNPWIFCAFSTSGPSSAFSMKIVMAFYPMRLGSHFQTVIRKMVICGSWTVIFPIADRSHGNRSYQSFGVPLRRKKMVVTWPWRCSRALVLRPSKENQFFKKKSAPSLEVEEM